EGTSSDVCDARVVPQARDLVAKMTADRDARSVRRPRQTETAAGQWDRARALEQNVRRYVVVVLPVAVLRVLAVRLPPVVGALHVRLGDHGRGREQHHGERADQVVGIRSRHRYTRGTPTG